MADELEGELAPLSTDEESIQNGLDSRDDPDAAVETEAQRLKQEAKAGGFGSLYAAYGGGLEGLRACAAGMCLWLVGVAARCLDVQGLLRQSWIFGSLYKATAIAGKLKWPQCLCSWLGLLDYRADARVMAVHSAGAGQARLGCVPSLSLRPQLNGGTRRKL